MSASPEPSADREPDDRVPADRPTRRLPSRRSSAIAASVAGIADGWLTARSGAGTGRVVAAALLMGLFVHVGIRWITARRLAHRPPVEQPQQRDPSAPPPPGGWANPTPGQRRAARLRRLSGDALSRGGAARDRRRGRR